MFANQVKHAPQIDQSRAIELQGFDCGAACGCQTDHQREIIVPGEVFLPTLLPRVEQWRGQTSYRIGSEDAGGFALITAITAKRQIGDNGKPAEDKREDVINCERIG